ncbi:MAG TPA: 3-oxo-tetronate kinase [Acidobacteriaceae bacterium]|jgi:uncharacterized protein YgbK (DUF1537 family)
MMGLFFGAIADDDTGATDLAGMLTEQGMHVATVLQGASEIDVRRWTSDCDAVVIGTGSRSIARHEAYARTASAAQTLVKLGAKIIAVKYCSTFDSTTEGNIGASIDAAMDVTGVRFTVALPALPSLGRTTYLGYHFVHDKLLSDSTMRHHPLNPMSNPHLPSHLQAQTSRRVGIVPYPVVAGDVTGVKEHLRKLELEGTQIALLDCVDNRQLRVLGEAACEMPLLTGSSAWGMILPQLWRERGIWHLPQGGRNLLERSPGGHGHLIVSGSCSEATAAQNAWAAANGIEVFAVDPIILIQDGRAPEAVVQKLVESLSMESNCLLASTSPARSQTDVHAWTRTQGISPLEAGERIGAALAQTVCAIFRHATPRGLIVAGGETSSLLMRKLELGGLRVGKNIDPGVPVCVALAQPGLGVVLKSGNFGSPDFYARAITAIDRLPLTKMEGAS